MNRLAQPTPRPPATLQGARFPDTQALKSRSEPARTSPLAFDALVLLTREHAALRQLFRTCERLMKRSGVDERKAALVGQICCGLQIHLQIKEEIFYPAVYPVHGVASLVQVALMALREGKALMARLDELEPGEDGADYDTLVAALDEWVAGHARHDEEALFPALRSAAGLDALALGSCMVRRRKALNEDVTRLGLPRQSAGVASWPQSCRIVIG